MNEKGKKKVIIKKWDVKNKEGKLISSTIQKTTVFVDNFEGEIDEFYGEEPPEFISRSSKTLTRYPLEIEVQNDDKYSKIEKLPLPQERPNDNLQPLRPFHRTDSYDIEYNNRFIGRSRPSLRRTILDSPRGNYSNLNSKAGQYNGVLRDIMDEINSQRRFNQVRSFVVNESLMKEARSIANQLVFDERISSSYKNVNVWVGSSMNPSRIVNEWSEEMITWRNNYFFSTDIFSFGVGIATNYEDNVHVVVAVYD